MKRCTKCILPENFPNIKFDDEGVCNYCLSHTPIEYKGEAALRSILNPYRGKGKKYDCVVAVSGGRDSTFALYEIAKNYNMKVLAFHWDNSFTTEQAIENLKNAARVLEIDLVSIKSHRDIQRRCVRDNIQTWARYPSSEALPSLCYGCREGGLSGVYKIAARMQIPLIITGHSEIEDSVFKKALQISVFKEALHLHRKLYLFHLFMKFVKNPFYLNPRNIYHYSLANAEFLLPTILCRYTMSNPPRLMNLFDYARWNERKILSTLENELEWKKPEDSVSSWRFDCKIHALLDYAFKKKLGFSEKDELYSKMIREGDLSRDEALERIEQQKVDEKMQLSIINEVFAELGLSKEKERILHLLSKPSSPFGVT